MFPWLLSSSIHFTHMHQDNNLMATGHHSNWPSVLSVEPATINKMCGLSVVIGTVGGVAMLPCQSQGISDFDRTWMEGGSEIVSEGRFTISEQMDGTLSISSLELSDSGVYTCTIKNRVALGEEVLGPVVNDSYSIQLVVRSELVVSYSMQYGIVWADIFDDI